MKKNLFIILLFLISKFLFPNPVSEDTAKIVALNFFNAVGDSRSFEPVSDVVSTDYLIQSEDTLIYLFHINPGDYVFISADDAAFPVLGYGFTGVPSWEEAHTSVKQWMGHRKKEILYIKKEQIKPATQTRKLWQSLKNNSYKSSSKGVEPLILSKWDQNFPYNTYAPADPAGSAGHTLSGCVAVAMAQLMYYYRFPETGTGAHGYTHPDYGYLSADFGNTQYKYSQMVDKLHTKKNDAIAELMYHCGVSVDMAYGPNASGSPGFKAIDALKNYFNFPDSTNGKWKDNYPDSLWDSFLHEAIDKKQPLAYSGFAADMSGGHAFILDGYQGNNFYHFNWGWSGNHDGYYYLHDLNPQGTSLSTSQGAIFGAVPDTNYPSFCSGPDTLAAMQGSFEDGSGHKNYNNNTACSWLIDPAQFDVLDISLDFKKVDLEWNNDFIRVYDGADTSAPLLAKISGDSIPGLITSTGQQLFITFQSDSAQTGEGFHAEYHVSLPDYCGSLTVIDSAAGSIRDGSGAFPYTNNTFCKWYIKPAGANRIEVDFTSLDTYDSSDKVIISDPSTSPATSLGEYYGSNLPNSPIISNSGEMFIVFVSNANDVAGGFELNYTSDVVNVDEKKDDAFLVYPNPSSGLVNIELPLNISSGKIQIFTIDGKLVRKLKSKKKFNLRLPDGIYYVKLTTQDKAIVKKIIISGYGK